MAIIAVTITERSPSTNPPCMLEAIARFFEKGITVMDTVPEAILEGTITVATPRDILAESTALRGTIGMGVTRSVFWIDSG